MRRLGTRWLCGLALLLGGCGQPLQDPVIDRFQAAVGAQPQGFLMCDSAVIKLREALRHRRGVRVQARSLLLMHPREGRSAFVARGLARAGLTRYASLGWDELSETSRRLDLRLPPSVWFDVYSEPSRTDTLYAYFDENAVSRYDGFCVLRIENPGGGRLERAPGEGGVSG